MNGAHDQAVADYLLTDGYDGRFRAFGIKDDFVTHGSRATSS